MARGLRVDRLASFSIIQIYKGYQLSWLERTPDKGEVADSNSAQPIIKLGAASAAASARVFHYQGPSTSKKFNFFSKVTKLRLVTKVLQAQLVKQRLKIEFSSLPLQRSNFCCCAANRGNKGSAKQSSYNLNYLCTNIPIRNSNDPKVIEFKANNPNCTLRDLLLHPIAERPECGYLTNFIENTDLNEV